MCSPGRPVSPPASAGEALAMAEAALGFLARGVPHGTATAEQAGILRALERLEAMHTAARATVLARFTAQDGCYDDGQHTTRAWLKWQTRVTHGAAAGAVGWMKRLAAHPAIAGALAAGTLSASWAREICGWSDRLPVDRREDADLILLDAAAAGAGLAGLAGLAEDMYRRCAPPDADDDGFEDRHLRLGTTYQGAGRLAGDLTPGCTAAVSAVLDALGKKAGPEDGRTKAQRDHDALHEACRRLIASGMLPGRAGQPTRLQVHMTLSQLRGLPGAAGAEAAWAAARAGRPGWLTGPEAGAAACDATVIPVVTGHADPSALSRLTHVFERGHAVQQATLAPASQDRLRRSLLALAIQTLSGPGGLASHLRTSLTGPGPGAPCWPPAAVSLPLDIGAATEVIPARLRRMVTIRHPHCAFPGCEQPASACDIHHLIPRARGGPTALWNLLPLCQFHHLVVVHRWGWQLTLNPDGTTVATSPDGTRTLHSHSPPGEISGETPSPGPPGQIA